MDGDGSEIEIECRVCREGGSDGRPLFAPCLCSGSILLCHQECLEEWLQHSRKDNCELCKSKYQFVPKYAPNTPEVLPTSLLLSSLAYSFYKRVLPAALRGLVAFFCWILLVPFVTSMIFRILTSSGRKHLFDSKYDYNIRWFYDIIISGIVLSGLIALTFLLLMSFADFIRQFWNENPNARNRRNVINHPMAPLPNIQPNIGGQANNAAIEVHVAVVNNPIEEIGQMNPLQPQELPINNNDILEPLENNNNHFGNEIEMNENGDFAEPANADIEIRLALDEIVGLRGPIVSIFKSAFWLMVFNCVFIGVCVFIPHGIGLFHNTVFHACLLYLLSMLPTGDILKSCSSFVNKIHDYVMECTLSGKVIRLNDLISIVSGYFAIVVVILALNWLLQFSKLYFSYNRSLESFVKSFENLSVVIKIVWLLGVRIFWMPTVVGLILICSMNDLLKFTFREALNFGKENIVGFIAISWGLGIAFMLTATISILQVREVLHPDFLSRIIRPQESHADLLSSLKHDSATLQFRRLCISFIVYVFLIIIFVLCPIKLYILAFQPDKITLYYCNVLSELQLPLEIGLSHTVFLVVLEKYKDLIGKVQYVWFLKMSKTLGITRFLIPHPIVGYVDVGTPVNCETVVIDGKVAMIGEPLVRPPAGWDARNKRSESRWAWITEEMTSFEKNVAPKIYPHLWMIKGFILVVSSWIFVILSVVILIFTPLCIGRVFFFVFKVPFEYIHDPACILLGLILFEWMRKWFNITKSVLEAIDFGKVCNSMKIRTLRLALLLLFKWIFLFPLTTGISFRMLFETLGACLHYTISEVPVAGDVVRTFFHDLVIGSIIVNCFTLAAFSGVLDSLLTKAGFDPVFQSLVDQVGAAWTLIVSYISNEDNEQLALSLLALDTLVMRRFTRSIVTQFVIGTVVTILPTILFLSPSQKSQVLFFCHLAFTVYMFCDLFMGSLTNGWRILLTTIKNDYFLIGRQLQDSVQGSKLKQEILGKFVS